MNNSKKDILIIMGRYLPGFKDGGPVRTIKNLVDYLGDEYNFRILTLDRDAGDNAKYPNILVNEWNQVGKAKVYYVSPKGFKFSVIKKLANDVELVYCCGCFSDYSIKTLILKRIKQINVPVVIASMGIFAPLEFKMKYIKKKACTTIFNFLGLFDNIHWSVTSDMEKEDVKREVKTNNNFFVAVDLPRKVENQIIFKDKERGKLKIAWISRIARNKNLKGAINILKDIEGEIEFTIYGPKQDNKYWNECEEELYKLGNNIKWEWRGSVESENVVDVFKEHQLFLFPTYGENFGHVIQESLSAGCPVIISDKTPWNDIEDENIGYIVPLGNIELFKEKIKLYVEMDKDEFQKISNNAIRYAFEHSKKTVNNTGYRQIFSL